ncbi:hypothetical protein NTE19_003347 [Vibrio fluvialis]|nr:hypothetical protein [Vibrio fluvialis]
MDHYQHLILKGLINGGGSSSESYTHSLLTGRFNEESSSVSRMWGYLDNKLQDLLIEIFDEVCGVDLSNKTDSQIVAELIDYMADKAGSREFYEAHTQREISAMSDDEYEKGLRQAKNAKKVLLLNKE